MISTANDAMMRVLLDNTDGGNSGTGFVAEFFNNIANYVKSVGSYVVVLAGIALIIVSVFMIIKAFASRGSTNWLIIIACIVTGGVLALGGWSMVTGSGEGTLGGVGKETLDELSEGHGTISDFKQSGAGATSVRNARKGLYVISSQFILPFGKALAVCTGVALVMLAVIQIAKFFFAGGRAQTSWLKVAAMCVIGSVLFAGTPTDNDAGWTWVRDVIAGSTKDTIVNMSKGKSGDAGPVDGGTFTNKSDNGENDTPSGANPADVPG